MKISRDIAEQVEEIAIHNEFRTAEINKRDETADLEDYVDMLDSVRTNKNYDWQSDISIPEFAAHMLTQASIDANTGFSTRDHVEVYVQDESNEAIAQAEAQKELINRTLNQHHLYYYQKFMRLKMTSNIAGRCYIRTDWERSTRKTKTGETSKFDKNRQVERIPVFEDLIDRDRFNFEVIDNRNVFCDNTYTYSMNEKSWIYIRSETTLERLKLEAESKEYFNLDSIDDKIEKKEKPEANETDTSRESYNKIDQQIKEEPISPVVDKLERFGKFWTIVEERDPETREILKGRVGINDMGAPFKGAELVECILTFAKHTDDYKLIGFKVTPFIDSLGNPFKPVIRGINYIHPTLDGGIGDGQYARDIQVGIDDTFNMSNDRVKFATTPVIKLAKSRNPELMDLDHHPGAVWDLDDANDVSELKVSDNIGGALQQIGMLTSQLDKTTSIFPTTQGALPQSSSTTATAIAGSESRSNQRGNYRALTFEYTFQKELYWQIAQMTMRFASPDTGKLLMGKKVFDFNPSRGDYTYKPISQTVETEFSKNSKIQKYTQLLQIVGGIPNPSTGRVMNKLLKNIFALMGDEAVNIAEGMFDEQAAAQQADQAQQAEAAKQQQQQKQPNLASLETSPSNQNGVPQGSQQSQVRGAAPNG